MRLFILFLLVSGCTFAGYQKELSISESIKSEISVLKGGEELWFIQDVNFLGKSIKTGKNEGFEQNVDDYFKFLKEQGYNRAYFTPVDSDGFFYFKSLTLNRSGWLQGPDLLSFVSEKAKKYNIFLVVVLDEFVGEDIRSLVSDLSKYSFDGFAIEGFSDDERQLIFDGAKKFGWFVDVYGYDEYGRGDVWSVDDYAVFPRSRNELLILNELGVVASRFGVNDVAIGMAKAANKPVIVNVGSLKGLPVGSESNFLIYRAVQHSPNGFGLLVFDPVQEERFFFNGSFKPIREKILEFQATDTKPFVNLVIDLDSKSSDFEALVAAAAEPITNAVFAAGFDLKVTINRFLPDADAFYVLTNNLTSSFVIDLLRQSKPVITQSVAQIPKVLSDFFALDVKNVKRDIPEKFRGVSLKGVDLGYGYYFIDSDFIVSKGNKHFVNGNNLHLEASYLISVLLNGSVKPFFGYSSVGKTSVFLAVDNSNVSASISGKKEIIHFNANGEVISSRFEEGISFSEFLKPFELVVVRLITN